MMSNLNCSLCGLQINYTTIIDEGKSFCCHGCQTVFQILSSRNEIEKSKEHPLFLEALKNGIISNPILLEQLDDKRNNSINIELHKHYFEIQEMWCYSCAELIRLMLLRKKGIHLCKIDYSTDLGSVQYDPRVISKEDIYRTIEKLGYRALPFSESFESKEQSHLKLRFSVASFCSLNIMMFSYPIYASLFFKESESYTHLLAILACVASFPLVTWCFWPILRKCWNSSKIGLLRMEALVVLGVGSAFFLSVFNLFQGKSDIYFDSMSTIISLVLLGKILENKAKFSSKNTFLQLLRSTPKKARKKIDDENYKFVPLKEVSLGDTLMVVTGEKIVLDGKVISGQGICDESIMTGEPFPRKKIEGDLLIGGTFLQQGTLNYEVTSNFEQTLLQKIFDSIHSDIQHKANYSRVVDAVVRYFVPIVFFLSVFTGIFTYFYLDDSTFSSTILKMISIFLISCPCAIGIAAPLVESYMIKRIANLGALIKNRGSLALLAKATHFFVDKTGTITEGKFKILNGLSTIPKEDLSILKAMTASSTHPISVATTQNIESIGAHLDKIEEFSGKGIKCYKGENEFLYGSKQFLEQEGFLFNDDVMEKDSSITTQVFFAKKGGSIYSIRLGDQLKKEADKFIHELKGLNTVLISGDSYQCVSEVAKRCAFDFFYAETSPLAKREILENIKKNGGIVAMIGDGINDAPALTAAHIGFSVISASDISIHVSDIFLTTEDLNVIPKMINIAKKGQIIIRQNLFWAFFYNILGITLAIAGYLTPFYAAFAMILSSLIVILNARRLCNSPYAKREN